MRHTFNLNAATELFGHAHKRNCTQPSSSLPPLSSLSLPQPPQVVNMTMGSMISALAEGAALAEASGLDQTKLLEVNGSLSKSTPYKEYSQIKREEINI